MPWIETVPYEESEGKLRRLYDRVKGPDNNVDNIMMMHSLRPHSMEGHMAIYKYVLHHTGNTIPKWFWKRWVYGLVHSMTAVIALITILVGFAALLQDDEKAAGIRKAIDSRNIDIAPLDDKQKLAMVYAEALTKSPASTTEEMVKAMRNAGYSDGEILEVNQVSSYFNYANRTVLGLGCSTKGDIIGLSPNNSDDPDDWSHT